MSENNPDQSQPAAQESYGVGRMFEDTLCAMFQPGHVFAVRACKPAPAYAVMIPNLMIFCAAVCVTNLLRACVATPELVHSSPSTVAIAAAAGLILAVPLSFVAAGALHAFMLLAGGHGDFQRSYQASSMLSILIALQAMLNWFDWVWVLPFLLAAWLATAAARALHRAPALRAGVVFGLAAAFCIAGQWGLRQQFSRWSQTTLAMQPAAEPAQDLSSQPQHMPVPLNPPQPEALSSLELPSPPRSVSQTESPVQAQAQSIQQATTNLLAPIMAMLKNPALTKGLSSEQLKQLSSLTAMMNQMQKSMAAGNKTTPAEQAAMMAQFQSAMMQFMAQTPAAQKSPERTSK
jgi:hypothetical protein